jgi:hypothetical protein
MKIGIKRSLSAPLPSAKKAKKVSIVADSPQRKTIRKKLTPEQRARRKKLPRALHGGPSDFESQKKIITTHINNTIKKIEEETLINRNSEHLNDLKEKLAIFIKRYGESANTHLEIYMNVCMAYPHYHERFASMYVYGYVQGVLSSSDN